jgi:hypothetical protein
MKYFITILFLFICLSISAQKMYFTYCKILDNTGDILKVWKGNHFVHWYGDFITVSSNKEDILSLLSPSTMDDPSDFRVFVRMEEVIYMPKRSGGYYRKTKFQDIESNFKFDILSENANGFFMFAINPSMVLVMDNLREKPKKKRK